MARIENIRNNNDIIGFTKKENIAESNRIYLGYVYENKIHKIGFCIQKFGSKFFMKQTLFDINYEINICEINFTYMEDRDIDFYKKLN